MSTVVQKKRERLDPKTKKYVEKLVWVCLECAREDYYEVGSPEGVHHDALCTQRTEPVRNSSERAEVLRELYSRANRVLGLDLTGVQKALREMDEMTLEYVPRGFKSQPGYEKGDEDAPFFSEAFLYNLLGKDAARTVLAHYNAVRRAAGMED